MLAMKVEVNMGGMPNVVRRPRRLRCDRSVKAEMWMVSDQK